ncbi:hypothetical protein NQ318_011891 [Aromia moschata]|uniref:Uncharacterized protein n=1 Tax=Aromia moschata TaxID=1265417 RepID=A0AAV8YB05_9CUCU|nr:hypothetical protein NQ318_011891 [Aromia moschata]
MDVISRDQTLTHQTNTHVFLQTLRVLLLERTKVRLSWLMVTLLFLIIIVAQNDVEQCHYLPHRPVVKSCSLTTKIRPVFDASAHENGKPSLNHCLGKRPNLIELIPSMLLKFGENKGIITDIKKTFLQISVHEKDRDYCVLRFLWVDSEGQAIL